MFKELKKIVDSIRLFDEKFGNYQKLVRTLESNYERLEDFKNECEELTVVLKGHKVRIVLNNLCFR